MLPGYFACLSSTILVLHAIARLLIVRPRHSVVVRQSLFAASEAVDVSSVNGVASEEKTFVELHGGLVLYLCKIARLLSCLAFLALSLVTFQSDRHGECLSGVSGKGCNMAYSWSSSSLGTSNSSWVPFSLRATSVRRSVNLHLLLFFISVLQAFVVFLSVITVASHTRFSQLVSAHLTVLLLTLFAVYTYRDIWPLLTFTEKPIDSCEGPLLWGKLAALTVGAVVYPLFSPRLYIPVDAKVFLLCHLQTLGSLSCSVLETFQHTSPGADCILGLVAFVQLG